MGTNNWKPIKGKCLLCGRLRSRGAPVLRYKLYKMSGIHVLQCTICKSDWSGPTKAAVINQIAEDDE